MLDAIRRRTPVWRRGDGVAGTEVTDTHPLATPDMDRVRTDTVAHENPREPVRVDGDVFVMSGGGAAGAAQAGMILALIRAGIVPSAVVGCSAGAINAAAIAANPTVEGAEDLVRTWQTLTGSSMLSGSLWSMAQRVALHRTSLVDRSDLEALVDHWFGGSGVSDLADLSMPCHVLTTRLRDGSSVYHTSGPVRDILLASAAVPGLLPPVRLQDGLHIDGGVVEMVPVSRGLGLGTGRVWVLDVSTANFGAGTHTSFDLLNGAFTLLARAQRFGRADPKNDERVRAIELSRDASSASLRDFGNVPEMLRIGREAAEDRLTAMGLIHAPRRSTGAAWYLPAPHASAARGA